MKRNLLLILIVIILIGCTFAWKMDRDIIVCLITLLLIIIIDSAFLYGWEYKRANKDIIGKFKANIDGEGYGSILKEVKKTDPAFDEIQFLNLAKNLFIKFQKNLYENSIDDTKPFLTDTFFEQQKKIEQKKKAENANEMNLKFIEFGGIRAAELYTYSKTEEYETITVEFQIYMIKNDFNMATGEKIKGLSGKKMNSDIYVEFRRSFMDKDNGKNEIIFSHCPKCGAPTQIVSMGKCYYCGAIIQVDTKGWKINSVRRHL